MRKYFINNIIPSVVLFTCMQTSAQEGLNITLRADYDTEKRIYHSEPLILTVTVSNQAAQSAFRWNMAAGRRLKEIDDALANGKMTKDEADKERAGIEKNKKDSPVIILGSTRQPWSGLLKWGFKNRKTGETVSSPVKELPNPGNDAMVMLDGTRTATGYFGISPEAMQLLSAGSYIVSVVMNGISSDEVSLDIQNDNMNETMLNSVSMLLKFGRYYWYENDSKKTMQYAERVLQQAPASVDALSLKGDAQMMDRSYPAALQTYRQALQEYYKQNPKGAEPPEYLMMMIGAAKERSGEMNN